MDASQRGNLLYKVADLMERDLDYLAVSEIFQSDKFGCLKWEKEGVAVSCLDSYCVPRFCGHLDCYYYTCILL